MKEGLTPEELIMQGHSAILWGTMGYYHREIGNIVSWFSNHWEKRGEDWKIAMMSPRYERTLETFKEIYNTAPLPGDISQRHALHAKHGSVQCIFEDEHQIYSIYAKHVLWVVECPLQRIWDILIHRRDEGTQFLGIEPPYPSWSVFANAPVRQGGQDA